MAVSEITNRRLKAADCLWVGVALLLHAALLFVSFDIPHEMAPGSKIISVTLVNPTNAEPSVDQPEEHELVKHQAKTIPEKKPPLVTPEPTESQQAEPLTVTAQALPKTVTTAQLLRSVDQLKFSIPDKKEPLELGAFNAQPLPANWSSSMKIDDNLFNGKVASAGSEIVDQWVDAGGGFNTVVKTPSGRTLCGQAQAWNPMNPLLEPVTMWRLCGGGGERASNGRR